VVSLEKGWGRWLLIAAPFLLIALGGYCLVRSPWPEILRATLHGAHVSFIKLTFASVALPAITVVSWGAAIWLSLLIKPRDAGK
jgi:hypothetical protein